MKNLNLKIGLDIHGVIDKYPNLFSKLSKDLIRLGHEVHIVTGQQRIDAEPSVIESKVEFTHFFSIMDYHVSIGTKMTNEDGNWYMDEKIWSSTKAMYAEVVGLDIHFDDRLDYLKPFPDSCSTVLVTANFDRFVNLIMELGGVKSTQLS